MSEDEDFPPVFGPRQRDANEADPVQSGQNRTDGMLGQTAPPEGAAAGLVALSGMIRPAAGLTDLSVTQTTNYQPTPEHSPEDSGLSQNVVEPLLDSANRSHPSPDPVASSAAERHQPIEVSSEIPTAAKTTAPTAQEAATPQTLAATEGEPDTAVIRTPANDPGTGAPTVIPHAEPDMTPDPPINHAPTEVGLQSGSVSEAAAAISIGQLFATDPDAFETMTFQTDDPRFEIVGDQLRLAPGYALDYENGPVEVEITATDHAGASLTQSFEITIADVAEHLTLAQGNTLFIDTGVAEQSISGGIGYDTIYGHADGAVIDGGKGFDRLYGADGDDAIFGSDGRDFLSGGAGADTLDGGSWDDTIIGGDGGDVLLGGTGKDLLSGDAGDDTLDGGGWHDTMSGGAGNDLALGGNGNDLIYGDAGNDRLEGGGGDDRAYGGQGDDHLLGGYGRDRLYGEDGDDLLDGGHWDDTLEGGAGADSLDGGAGSDLLDGGTGNDLLYGGAGGETDTLIGGDGADHFVIFAQQGNDVLHGGAGGWTDLVEIGGGAGAAVVGTTQIDGTGWTLTLDAGHSIVTNGADSALLSPEASGTIQFDSGGLISFDGIEQVIW